MTTKHSPTIAKLEEVKNMGTSLAITAEVAKTAVEALERIMKAGTTPDGNTAECHIAYEAISKIRLLLWQPQP